MPQMPPPLRGLQAAVPPQTPEDLINQRQGVNQMMGGRGMPPPAAPAGGPTPEESMAMARSAGLTGRRTGDIELPDENAQSVDELTRRVNAIMGGAR